MKLLVYSHYFAPSIGGVETIVLGLSRGLAELRIANGAPEFEITVVTETPAGNYDDPSLPFRVIRQPGLFYLWRLVRACDVIHAAGPALLPLFLARLAGKPAALEHHGYQAICPNGILVHQPDRSVCPGHFQAGRYAECLRCNARETSWPRSCRNLLLMFLRHALTRRAAANVAVSQHVMQRLAMPRSTVIYHGIDDPLSNASSSHPSPGRICFGYAGRLVPEKGIPVLVQAVKKLIGEGHQFDVRLIGDGDERPSLEEMIGREQLESCVQITGYLTGTALSDAIRDVQVLVMPSNWEETAGLAAIEQMMRGRLVIVSDIGGLGEIAGDAGLRFTPGNADALADCMRKVLRDPSLIESFGRRARERALRLFTRSRMTEGHARIYRGIFRENES
jgi:glycosyltransferase involved in cell wall biosynthesis